MMAMITNGCGKASRRSRPRPVGQRQQTTCFWIKMRDLPLWALASICPRPTLLRIFRQPRVRRCALVRACRLPLQAINFSSHRPSPSQARHSPASRWPLLRGGPMSNITWARVVHHRRRRSTARHSVDRRMLRKRLWCGRRPSPIGPSYPKLLVGLLRTLHKVSLCLADRQTSLGLRRWYVWVAGFFLVG